MTSETDYLDELEAQLDRLDREANFWGRALTLFQVIAFGSWLAFGVIILLR